MFDNKIKRKVTLNIGGTDLVILTTESDEELKKLEESLSTSIETIMENKPSASKLDAALLVALSDRQRLFAEDKTAENLRTQVREYANEANKAVLELADTKREIEVLKQQINQLKNKRY